MATVLELVSLAIKSNCMNKKKAEKRCNKGMVLISKEINGDHCFC